MLQTSSILRAATGIAVAAFMTPSLAGCSGATHALPGGIAAAAQSRQTANAYNARLLAIPNASNFIREAQRRGASHDAIRSDAGTKCLKNVYIYTSENITGDLDVFCEDATKKAQNTLVSSAPGKAGFGLAVTPDNLPNVPTAPCSNGSSQELLAAGTDTGTINIYCNLASGAGYVLLNTLTLPAGDALGICWDETGGIYATEWPNATIAHFTESQVIGPAGPPTTLNPNVNVVEYHLACDYDKLVLKGKPKGENYLMAYGFDANYNVNITNVNTTSGSEAVEQTLGNYSAGTGFPGGLALDRRDDLAANDQYGTMYWFNPELWNTPPRGACTWGFNPNDYTNIVFDDAQNEIWAANVHFVSSILTTYGQSNRFPFGSGACGTGSSGYQTSHPIAGEQENLGIAVWPNRGV